MNKIFFKGYTQDGDGFSGEIEVYRFAPIEYIHLRIIAFVKDEYGDDYNDNKIEIVLDHCPVEDVKERKGKK